MPKATFKIAEFEGGENRVKNPRDLELNESAMAFGVEFDKVGRIRTAGNGIEITPLLYTFNNLVENLKLVPGYGLFQFSHDFNMDEVGDGLNPQEEDTKFIAVAYYNSSGIKVGFVDEKWGSSSEDHQFNSSGYPSFIHDTIILLDTEPINKPKITFFFADGGLRISDGEFLNNVTDSPGNEIAYNPNIWYGHIKRTLFSKLTTQHTVNEWIQDNQSLEKGIDRSGSNDSTYKNGRPYTSTDTTLDASLQYFDTLTNANYAGHKEEVRFEIAEDTSNVLEVHNSTASTHSNGITTITLTTNHGFSIGDMIELYNCTATDTSQYNGQYEVLATPSTSSFNISLDSESTVVDINGKVIKVEHAINPELKKGWIFGISFILDDGQETQIAVATTTGSGGAGAMGADNYADWRAFVGEPKMRFAFSHANDDIPHTYLWNKRITGFRIYQKDVEGTTEEDATQEWHLMTDVDFIKGQYVLPGRDSTEINLINHSSSNYANHHDGTSNWDDLRFLSPITFESLNGYTASETIAARYKTSVIANERCYIANIEQNSQRFPDRIIKSPVGAYDVYPESMFLDSVFSDGDEIIKLEEFADRILSFKRNTLYIINVSDEEEYLENVYHGYGIEEPHQSVKTQHGVVFVNSSGLHLYNGTEITNLTETKRKPWEFNPNGVKNPLGFYFKESVPTLGYDRENDKVILLRTVRAIDYQIDVSADNAKSINEAFTDNDGYVKSVVGKIPDKGTVLQMTNNNGYDFTGNELGIAKFGPKGTTGISDNDIFVVSSNFTNKENVKYIDLDSDVLIYDMKNNAVSYRNFAFGSNNTGFIKTNFINTSIFGESQLLLLKDASGTSQDGTNIDIIKWEDAQQTVAAEQFKYMTRDIDLGNPSVRKKIYKVYVTFRTHNGLSSHSDSNVKVYYLENQNTETYTLNISDWTEFSNTASTNYGSNGLYSEGSDSDWQLAELKPSSSINNVYSMQLLFYNPSGIVPMGFEINDISVVYRQKPVK